MRIFFSLFLALTAFCSFAVSAHGQNKPLQVIVSIAPQKWIVERIGGDHVQVTVLATPGSDPHSYEPSPAQMRACAQAQVYFTLGVQFEEIWVPRIADTAKNLRIASTIKGMTRFRFTEEGLIPEPQKQNPEESFSVNATDDLDAHKGHGHGADTHVWLAPGLVRYMIPIIVKELARLSPGSAETFKANAARLESDLEDMDQAMAQKFAAIPQEKRSFLTFHPAWGYFAHSYGLKELSIEVEGKEPGPKAMKTIIDTARSHGITIVLAEPQFSKAAASAVADNLKARVVSIDPLAENLPETWKTITSVLITAWSEAAPQKTE